MLENEILNRTDGKVVDVPAFARARKFGFQQFAIVRTLVAYNILLHKLPRQVVTPNR